MRELLAAPCRRLFLAAGAALVALTLPLGFGGAAVGFDGDGAAAASPVLPVGFARGAGHLAGVGDDDTGTTPGLLPADLAQRLEDIAGAGAGADEPAPTSSLSERIAAALADEGGAAQPATTPSLSELVAAAMRDDRGSLRTADLGRYLVLAVGLLLWAGFRHRSGRSATVPTIAGTALVGYVALSLLRGGITTTLFMLIVAFVLALSTVVTVGLPGRRAAQPA